MQPKRSRLLWLPRRGQLPSPIPSAEPPVIVLHGTLGSPGNFEKLARALRARGRRVIGLEYGQRGTGDLAASEREVIEFISQFPLVDVIGHSLGGLMGLRAAHELGNVRVLLGLGAAWRGVPRSRRGRLFGLVAGPAYHQLQQEFPAHIPAGVSVVSVVSTADVIVPLESSALGHVIEVPGVSHARLPDQTEVIVTALESAASSAEKWIPCITKKRSISAEFS